MKKGTVYVILGLLLIAVAFSITGYNVYVDIRAHRTMNGVIDVLTPQISDDPVKIPEADDEDMTELEYPDYILNPRMEMPVKTIDGVDYVAVLELPSLDRKFSVCSEWNYAWLNISPCRYSGTPYLNNLVICAHNYSSHFGLISQLKLGDPVIFTDMDGNIFKYEVFEIETIAPTEIEQMTIGDDWDLTLFTCTISGMSRVTVRCKRIEDIAQS